MRKLLLGSALAAALMIGANGMSFASTTAPVTPELRLETTGTIHVFNEAPLSNQNPEGSDDSSNNGNNGNSGNGSGN
jgi:hypothetical protein